MKVNAGFRCVSVAWLAYLPLPGLAVVPALVHGDDRLARFHAWQGGVLVVIVWILLAILGALLKVSDASGYQGFIGFLALVVLIAYIVAASIGIVAVVREQFVRVRPVYDVLALVNRG